MAEGVRTGMAQRLALRELPAAVLCNCDVTATVVRVQGDLVLRESKASAPSQVDRAQ